MHHDVGCHPQIEQKGGRSETLLSEMTYKH